MKKSKSDSKTIEPAPSYMNLSQEGFWSRIEMQFVHLADFANCRLQTREEAVGVRVSKPDKRAKYADASPRWNGQWPYLLLPYVQGLSRERLADQIATVRELAPVLAPLVKERHMSAEFVELWGRFSGAGRILEFLSTEKTYVGHLRQVTRAKEDHGEITDDHLRWYAIYFFKAYSRGARGSTDDKMEALINSIASGSQAASPNPSFDWYDAFLALPDRKTLKNQMREISVKQLHQYLARGTERLHLLDLEFPP